MAQNSLDRNRRASIACLSCRKKKIRCDVVSRGKAPCRPCRVSGDECLLAESRRGRHRNNARPLAEVPPHQPVQESTATSSFQQLEETGHQPESSLDSGSTHGPPLLISGRNTDPEKGVLPAYIQPLPPEWLPENIEFLRLKGALSCPSDRVRNALINSYISWVHGFCPVIDLHEFLPQVVHSDGSCGKVSLLILYAVMFAGVAFVPFEYICSAGYATRHAARDDFFSRAKLLYDFEYDVDRVRAVQALLLMSYWQDDKHDALQNHWYWVALANDVGRSISLNQEPAQQLSLKAARLRRRLGWTCFVRDRILSIGVRQTPSLLLDQFRLRPLEIEDFDIQPFLPDVLEVFGQSKLLVDNASQVTLAKLYMDKIQLCVILDRVFNHQYTNQTLRPSGTSELTTALVERDCENEVEFDNIHVSELENWLACLPEECRYHSSPSPFLNPLDEVTRLHQAFLYMLYHAVHLTISQPRLARKQTLSTMLRCVSFSSVAITRVAEDLQDCGILHFLPSAAVSMLVRAAVGHLYEYRTAGRQNDQSVRRFLDTLNYMTQLMSIHKYATFASSFLCYSAQKLGISSQIPLSNPIRDYGIWEDVHSPQRLLKDSSTPDSSSRQRIQLPAQANSNTTNNPPNAVDTRPRFISQENIRSAAQNIRVEPTQLPSQVWANLSGSDIDLCADPTYEASLDSWYRSCFEPLIYNEPSE